MQKLKLALFWILRAFHSVVYLSYTFTGKLLYNLDRDAFCGLIRVEDKPLQENDKFREKIAEYLLKTNEWSVKRASLDLGIPYGVSADIGKKLESLGIIEKSREFCNLRILAIFSKDQILQRLYSSFTYRTISTEAKKIVLEKTIKIGDKYILAGNSYEMLQREIDLKILALQ